MELSGNKRKLIVKTAIFLSGLVTILSFGLLVQAGEVKETVQEVPAYHVEDAVTENSVPAVPDTLALIPHEQVTFSEKGIASWYGPGFHGRRTANGEIYDMNAFTAAHKTLPFGTILRVTNRRNGKSVLVRINDRGPYIRGRVVDLSRRAARAIDLSLGKVTIEAFLPVQRARKKNLPELDAAPLEKLSFTSEFTPVALEGERDALYSSASFTKAVRTWQRLQDEGRKVFLTIVQPTDESSLKTAHKWIRSHRGTPYYHYVLHIAAAEEGREDEHPADALAFDNQG